MFKQKLILAGALIAPLMVGCSSSNSDIHATAVASLKSQTAQIITRPTEYAYETIGTASGEANQTAIFGIVTEGDKPASVSVLGLAGSASPLENLAAYRAVESLGGDGFFKLSTEVKSSGFWPFVSTKHIKVTGKVLKIRDLGSMDVKRTDKLRETAIQSASGLSQLFSD